ncbi:Mucin-associated surface protein (MASP), subgroup S063 [Trypanosoma cruzi]|nr:Mucin-associated surface protein (MASP), subgroup S063 [Trypanosoma cruzi]KAF8288478.1 Mucin-associated surface protein (MASP), subgroup S063 [Trypanosoma cruzi]
MMMMMTGRVLLVCALCVLWCGTAGAAADGSEERADLSGIGGESLPESKGIGKSPEGPQGKKDEAGDVNGKKPPASSEDEGEEDEEEDDADGDEEDYDVVVDDDDLEEEEREEETVDPAETEIPNGQTKEEASSPPQSKHEKGPTPAAAAAAAEGIPIKQSPATPVQPTTQGQPPTAAAAPSPEDSPVPAASAATVTPAVTSSEQGNMPAAARKKDEKQSEDIDQAQENEQPNPQDVVLVQQSQGVHESKEPNNNPRDPASASATANQLDATFNGHGEPAQTTSSTKSFFESNDANSGTEEGITKDDPAADGAGTNDTKNSQNKHDNTKETPVQATAMKGATATTGDSDGSTAVSHTTSPLLLLVVACVAAAAVVAA